MAEPFDPYAAPDEPRLIASHKRGGGWLPIYLAAMLSGAFILSACLERGIRGDDLDGPGAGVMILFLFAIASMIGAAGGFTLVAIVHVVSKSLRDRDTGNLGKFGRDLGDGF